ncbi:formate dehydrogenase iron-sulfur subunit [Sphingobium boeckii]|uniref:Formate dehydrogenase iron-sulfur subunit n=2 Tax=Sphingobium boeckii TaxID=1082345 RepID=A0A7W9ALB9_9SPHN|nr:NADH-ubiquinone oxidoreductase-F iron-sulfur binding region domain-containing protein [Sphingobium boeckii]MBB5687794.1 formate dehydrogenase iron-sulfur subunit [Sphingobium boeckii]
MQIRISDDALALACGADRVTTAFAKAAPDADIRRVSSWGMHWLEPLVEIDGIGYGPVTPADVDAILFGTADALRIGRIEDHPFIASQTRLTFARAGKTRSLSLDDYDATGGWKGLRAAQAMTALQIVETVTASGLRGRGGAGFPAGIKWKTVLDAPAGRKYIVCNADEGDSGTFADRMVMEGDPYMLIEGMAIAGLATGAGKGFIYVRSEYPHAIAKLEAAVARSRMIIAPFEIEVREGAGAYVCGEETSLLNSLEGKRGEVRAKPPLPAHEGLFGCPTVINNVLTLAAIPYVLAQGAEAYAAYGMGRSRGTMPIQLAGNLKYGGLYETAFGVTLGELVDDIGGGCESGRPVRAVQVGGPLGAYFPPALFDTPFDYEAFAAADGLIGHGGVTVFDTEVDMAAQARFAMTFCAVESCGKCTPCRLGSTRGVETIDRIIAARDLAASSSVHPEPVEGSSSSGDPALKERASTRSAQTELEDAVILIEDLCDTMKFGSLCALGGFTPYPVLSALHHFPEDFGLKEAAE